MVGRGRLFDEAAPIEPRGDRWAFEAWLVSLGQSLMNALVRRLAAVVVAAGLVILVAADLWITGMRDWWDRHSLTSSVVSNLLVLAVAGLIVDEVVARRRRQERAVSVAVQGLIVYGQTRRAHDAVSVTGSPGASTTASDELRTLASMVLTAAPNLFDDPVARKFLEEVERFSVSMVRIVSRSPTGAVSTEDGRRLASEMARLKEFVNPLLNRIPTGDRNLLEGGGTGAGGPEPTADNSVA